MKRDFPVPAAGVKLRGQLRFPSAPRGLIILANLQEEALPLAADPALAPYGVLSVALMTGQELDLPDSPNNVSLLSERLVHVLDMARKDGDTENLPICLYASGHATPAAIRAAARRDAQVQAVVCRGGLVDGAGLQYLRLLAAPLLMLLDEGDPAAATSYRRASPHLAPANRCLPLGAGENPAIHLDRWFGDLLLAI